MKRFPKQQESQKREPVPALVKRGEGLTSATTSRTSRWCLKWVQLEIWRTNGSFWSWIGGREVLKLETFVQPFRWTLKCWRGVRNRKKVFCLFLGCLFSNKVFVRHQLRLFFEPSKQNEKAAKNVLSRISQVGHCQRFFFLSWWWWADLLCPHFCWNVLAAE